VKIGVLYVVGSFKSGGTETQLLEILRRLDRSRFQPIVVCFEKRGGLLPEVERLRVPVEEIGTKRFVSTITWRALRAHAARALSHGVRIIQGFHFHGSLYGALLKGRCAGARLVACEQALYGPDARHHRAARSWYYGRTDSVVANCEAVRQAVASRDRIDPDRIAVIYGGVDIERFRPRRAGGSLPAGFPGGSGPFVGLVGRLHPDKGQMLLVEAAPSILESVPGARFVLAGEGPQRAEIESAIAARNLAERFTLLGDRRDVPDLLGAFDLLVLPSASEGFSNAVLEGSASGIPVIASAVGGNPEIVVEGETGKLFPAGDRRALADAVIEVLREPGVAVAMGEAGRRRVEEMFPLDSMVRNHEKLYDTLLGATGSVPAAGAVLEAS
jgi:glycosyltransferase involved in cell wall biosynthesis